MIDVFVAFIRVVYEKMIYMSVSQREVIEYKYMQHIKRSYQTKPNSMREKTLLLT